jgi:DNA (cytosine-5)-methyltransferase 1
MNRKIYNHIAPRLSDLEWEMAKHIPEGGNWQNIPTNIPSKRLEQIRKSGGRTTYYGRLSNDKPSFTITTYFNRLGNGCNLHPSQDRIISIREGARLQSFRDDYIFLGSKASQYKQIGNAVPPLLARAISELLKPVLKNKTFIDLFAGAGGMSEGFISEGYELLAANEIEASFFKTFQENHKEFDVNGNFVLGDITKPEVQGQLYSAIPQQSSVGVVVGGPPCQGFSHAGWRDPNDKRNQLFKEFVKVVEKLKPEFFVMENVPGILTMRKGEAMKEIIETFKAIGYNVNAPLKLKAEEFGVPQKRRRVLIIGSVKKIEVGAPKVLFSENLDSLPSPITVKEAIGSLPKLQTGEGQEISELEYKAVSNYDKLMLNEISFLDFYRFQSSGQLNSAIRDK